MSKQAEAKTLIPAINTDGTLFPVEKMQAHIDALFHLAVSIFVFDGDALLIQRRAAEKYHCGGMWANTACTHPRWDEPKADAASRRLKEEMGFSLPLEERRVVEYSADVGNGLHEHELVTMYTARVQRDEIDVRPNPEEVDAFRWVTAGVLRSEIAANPECFAPWFRIYVERFPELEI